MRSRYQKATRPLRPLLPLLRFLPFLPVPPLQPIPPDLRHADLENPGGIALRHREALAGRHQAQFDGARGGLEHPNEIAMRTEDGERVAIDRQARQERPSARALSGHDLILTVFRGRLGQAGGRAGRIGGWAGQGDGRMGRMARKGGIDPALQPCRYF